MDFMSLIRARYSVRAYKTDPVDEETLHKVLEAARLAPTAANNQPFQFIVIRTKGREEELRRIYNRDWFVRAPLVICGCGIPADAYVGKDGTNYATVDVIIAMDHLILAATEFGLGTCWVGAFEPDATREVLGLPDGVEPVIFTPLGYPADAPEPKERLPLEALVRYDRW
ncbi:MAG: nitroreductase [Anaerolineales bacterium]|nr:nitroreductase [Anaerolineales bacterium]